jgi:predicted nuclease with TOPRIM domain
VPYKKTTRKNIELLVLKHKVRKLEDKVTKLEDKLIELKNNAELLNINQQYLEKVVNLNHD